MHRLPLSEVVLRLRVMLDDQHARTHPRDSDKKNDKKDKNDKNDENDNDGDGDGDGGGKNDDENDVNDDGNDKGDDEGDGKGDGRPALWRFDGVGSVLMALLEPPALEHVRRALQVRRSPTYHIHMYTPAHTAAAEPCRCAADRALTYCPQLSSP